MGKLGGAEKDIVNAVRDWSAENPNATETVEAALNVAAAAKLAKTGAGKATVSEDFSEAYHAGRNLSSVDEEMFQTRNVDFKATGIGTNIHDGSQGKHIVGHNNYIEGKSTLNRNINPQELLNGIHEGRYPVISRGARGKPVVDFGKNIGTDAITGLNTNFGTVHSSKKGVHIVPTNPNTIKRNQ